MKNIFILCLAAASLAGAPAPAWAQASSGQIPAQAQIINLSLLEALVAIKATDLGGVFGFIPEDKSAMAMADYLMHNHKALKRFIKKGECDIKTVQGVNDWDKQVYLYLVGINSALAMSLDARKVPEAWMSRINALSLAQALPLQVMVQRRHKTP